MEQDSHGRNQNTFLFPNPASSWVTLVEREGWKPLEMIPCPALKTSTASRKSPRLENRRTGDFQVHHDLKQMEIYFYFKKKKKNTLVVSSPGPSRFFSLEHTHTQKNLSMPQASFHFDKEETKTSVFSSWIMKGMEQPRFSSLRRGPARGGRFDAAYDGGTVGGDDGSCWDSRVGVFWSEKRQ